MSANYAQRFFQLDLCGVLKFIITISDLFSELTIREIFITVVLV